MREFRFRAFGQRVFADGALPSKTKELIAVAVAHVTQCPYCIRGHTELALNKGATEQEIIDFCRERMARFKVPKRVIFGAVPKTSTGKIQKFALREKAKSASAIDT